jgi:toxin FitB
MRDVVIDTGTASLLQRREAPPWVLRQLADTRIWLTFITVAELAKWAVMREWDESRRGRLEAWTAGRPVIPFDPRIAQLWGELTGQAKLRGRIPLVALNSADWGDFAEHHGLVLLGDREAGRRR